MNHAQKQLLRKAKRLAAEFRNDCQAVFDDPNMDDALYNSNVMQALLMAQEYADDVGDTES